MPTFPSNVLKYVFSLRGIRGKNAEYQSNLKIKVNFISAFSTNFASRRCFLIKLLVKLEIRDILAVQKILFNGSLKL